MLDTIFKIHFQLTLSSWSKSRWIWNSQKEFCTIRISFRHTKTLKLLTQKPKKKNQRKKSTETGLNSRFSKINTKTNNFINFTLKKCKKKFLKQISNVGHKRWWKFIKNIYSDIATKKTERTWIKNNRIHDAHYKGIMKNENRKRQEKEETALWGIFELPQTTGDTT